jgi:hypothetical protein
MIEEGVNVGFFAIKQYLTYGYFNGSCNIDGQKVEIENVYGLVEHVFNRW